MPKCIDAKKLLKPGVLNKLAFFILENLPKSYNKSFDLDSNTKDDY